MKAELGTWPPAAAAALLFDPFGLRTGVCPSLGKGQSVCLPEHCQGYVRKCVEVGEL